MLPKSYDWLRKEAGPKVLLEAVSHYGLKEAPGTKNNPIILSWAKDLGLAKTYTNDAIAWCGLFAAIVVKRAGYEPVKDPLWARNWAKWGNKADKPSLGDVLVFSRPGGGGHVGFYVGEDASAYHCLGGNTVDDVSVARIAKGRLLAARRSPFKIGQPDNVRPVKMAASGKLSTNEA
jgi:uncharacterized protein (TIGR02594 family)